MCIRIDILQFNRERELYLQAVTDCTMSNSHNKYRLGTAEHEGNFRNNDDPYSDFLTLLYNNITIMIPNNTLNTTHKTRAELQREVKNKTSKDSEEVRINSHKV